jgi:DNA-binding transcriptional LysR family regulator
VQLFHRTTREVQLTTAGSAFYEQARPVLAAFQRLTHSLPEQAPEPSGALRITAPIDMTLSFLAAAFAQFLVRYPGITLDVRPSNRVADLVGEGFDAALRVAPRLKDSTLVARKLGLVDLGIFAAPAYLAQLAAPRSLADCSRHRWVSFSGLGRLPAELRAVPASRVATDDLLLAHAMVRLATGLAVLPGYLAHEDVLAGRLVRVLPGWKQTVGTLYFVYPPAQHVPRKVTALRDYLVDVVARRPLALP